VLIPSGVKHLRPLSNWDVRGLGTAWLHLLPAKPLQQPIRALGVRWRGEGLAAFPFWRKLFVDLSAHDVFLVLAPILDARSFLD
jgi:hypothetical protein